MKHPRHVLLVPVKAPSLGKSRLQVPDHLRPELATAFALDTITAAREAADVIELVVITSDHAFTEHCAALGVPTVPDGAGLNDSLVGAAAVVRRRLPAALPVGLCADLPSLRPSDLEAALIQIDAATPWFVSDAAGTGTTLYAAPYDAFFPRFGTGSAAAHRRSGAREVEGLLPTLRHDVDDHAALVEALAWGVGPHTRTAAVAIG